MFTHDAEEHRVNFDDQFEKGKKLSDFIGMIVRLSFTVFAASWFWTSSRAADGLMVYVFGFCAITSLGLSLALAGRIQLIVLLYEARDMPKLGKAGKWIAFAFALASTITLYAGTYALVRDLAAQVPGS